MPSSLCSLGCGGGFADGERVMVPSAALLKLGTQTCSLRLARLSCPPPLRQNPDPASWIGVLAEGEGFEPSVACATSVFKTGALNQTLPPLRVGIDLREICRLCKSQNKDFSKWENCAVFFVRLSMAERRKRPHLRYFFRMVGPWICLWNLYWLRTEKLSSPVLIFASCWMSGFWI